MRLGTLVFGAVSAAAISTLVLAGGARAGVVFDATAGATAHVGYIAGTDATAPGTVYNHPSFPAAQVIDGDLGTRTDTYSGSEVSALGNNTAPFDFIGLLWGSAVSDIVAVRLHQFLYFDGGWFGTAAGDANSTNTSTPGTNTAAANAADAADVAAPTVQVTTDSGATWTAISATEDYVTIVQPFVASDFIGRIPTPITFGFAAQSGINGIRLAGYGGGRSDVFGGRDEQGFVSAAEFEVGRAVAVPAPGAATLLVAGLTAFGLLRRRRARRA